MILSRIEDRRRRRRHSASKTRVTALMAPSLTRSSTRTTSIQAIKAASRSAGDRSSLKILEAVSRVAYLSGIRTMRMGSQSGLTKETAIPARRWRNLSAVSRMRRSVTSESNIISPMVLPSETIKQSILLSYSCATQCASGMIDERIPAARSAASSTVLPSWLSSIAMLHPRRAYLDRYARPQVWRAGAEISN